MFFDYDQNNSGGGFDFDAKAGISTHVIIEAADADEANEAARRIGLYFDGYGDCECCGNRWYEAYGDGGTEPKVYGHPVEEYGDSPYFMKWLGEGKPEVFVHYANGEIRGFVTEAPKR